MIMIVGNCLFGVVKLTANNDPNKYEQSRYGIGFKAPSEF